MLRENAWRDYQDLSSSEFMKESKQNIIFLNLLEYIDYLGEVEDDILSTIKIFKHQQAYKTAFDHTPVSQLLLLGVKKLKNTQDICRKRISL